MIHQSNLLLWYIQCVPRILSRALHSYMHWNLKLKVTKIHLAAGFLLHNVPSEFWFLALFVQQNFLKISKVILHFWVQEPHFYIFFKTKKKSLRILKKPHLMPKLIFQKSHFSKIFILWKNISKFSKCSKKLFFVRKLNDGSIQTCEVWFDPSSMFTGWEIKIQNFFIYHIFRKPKGSLKSQKKSAGHIRWNLKLKVTKIHLAAGFSLHNVPSEFRFSTSFGHKKGTDNIRGTHCITT